MSGRSASFLQQQGHSHCAEVSLLCSLPTTVYVTVSQVALLPSYTGSLHCYKSDRSAPFLQQ